MSLRWLKQMQKKNAHEDLCGAAKVLPSKQVEK